MKIGYARVSTIEQNLSLQEDALEKAGCEKILTDEISGSVAERPSLTHLQAIMRGGDILVVWRLDRLGRSLKHLITWINYFEERGIAFQSIQENIDTSSSTGRLIFHIFGALAEFECNLIKERTQAGLAAARARGRTGGRKKKLTDEQVHLAKKLYKEGDKTVKEISELVGVSRQRLYSQYRIHES